MRQPQPQTPAPLDPDPKWPDGYIEALRRAGDPFRGCGTLHAQNPAADRGDGDRAAMAETGLDWRVLEERVRESLRIEHYSYSTAPFTRCSAMPTLKQP